MKNGKACQILREKNTTLVYATSSSVFFFFFRILVTLPIFMFYMLFQLILRVLLTPTNHCFDKQVIPPPERLGVVDQTFTKHDMCTWRRRQGEGEEGEGEQEAWPPKDRSVQEIPVTCPDLLALARTTGRRANRGFKEG